MNPVELAAQVNDALKPRDESPWVDDLHAAQDRVHAVIERAFELVAPHTTLRRTGYFNHSFVPDFVMSWEDGVVATKRYLYLKFGLRSRLDAKYNIVDLAQQSPVILGLSEQTEELAFEYDPEALDGVACTLVAPLSGLGALAERPGDRSERLIRHGHGFLLADSARKASVGHEPTLAAMLPADAPAVSRSLF